MKRHKIRLERGDTLGGTVPLLLRDRVTADFKSGSIHRRRAESRFISRRRESRGVGGFGGLLLILLVALAGGSVYGLVFEPVAFAALLREAWDWAAPFFQG